MRAVLAHRIRMLTAVTALAATAGIALLMVQSELGSPLLSPRTEVQPVSTATTAPSTEAASQLELSVFDQPREVPEIRFKDAEDRDLTLADFRGKVVLLNIWATWCVPCRKEMPALDRLQAQLGGDDFIVLPLSIDRKGLEVVKPFYQELGLKSLGIYLDSGSRSQSALAIPGVPTTLLIDRDGREVARKMGAAEWDSPEMLSLIRSYLPSRSNRDGKAGQ